MNVRAVNETHDPSLRSWVVSANRDDADFPIQNLPFGVFRRVGSDEPWRGGVAIGDAILDLAALHESAIFWGEPAEVLALACRAPLNDFLALGHDAAHTLRVALSRALAQVSPVRMKLGPMLVAQKLSEFALPMHVGDYTDFYSSLHHATAVGKLFRPNDPLAPNYKWMPIGYHGRASSVVVSGTPIVWPSGQRKPSGQVEPNFGPSRALDYEAELGVVIGRGNSLGVPVPLDASEEHIAGVCVLNDWSARDIQSWEYQPLGPFLGKSFATTLSPWIVTLEALAPFRLAWPEPSAPVVLGYLRDGIAAGSAAIDVRIATRIWTSVMRTAHEPAFELARSSWADAYWTAGQLVAHHTSNGCNLRPGDVLGTGTLSGPLASEAGSLLELTAAASRALSLPNGQQRRYLELGDCVEMTAFCEAPGARRIGFGFASGVVTPFEPAFAL